jgi:SH3-like domain-containing protein
LAVLKPLATSSTILPRRRWLSKSLLLLAGTAVIVYAANAFYVTKKENDLRRLRATEAGEITGSISGLRTAFGPSGLPLPRFVTLKSSKVNVRRGPSSDHDVAWVYQRKGLPVEITAEFENWRRVRGSDGREGWILQQMLSGKRHAVIMPETNQTYVPLRESTDKSSSVVAHLRAGVLGEIGDCDGIWCEISAGGYDGYVEQARLWGAYPGETIN